MALKTLLMGYTCRCFLNSFDEDETDIKQIFLTSYSLSINTNVIKSNATRKLLESSNSTDAIKEIHFKRLNLNAVRDCPVYELSLSFQLTPGMLKFLQEQLCDYSFHKPLKCSLQDQFTGINSSKGMFYFDECYVSNFSINVDNNAVVSVNMSLTYYCEQIELQSNEKTLIDKIDWMCQSGEEQYGGGNLLVPYYSCGVDYFKGGSSNSSNYEIMCPTGEESGTARFKNDHLQSFSFTFQHNLTPKYALCASDSKNAIKPKKIVFSVPTINYELSYIYADRLLDSNYNDYYEYSKNKQKYQESNKIVDEEQNESGWNLQIRFITYGGDDIYVHNSKKTSYISGFLFTKCYPDTYTPNVAQSGSVNTLNISGTIYGKLFKLSKTSIS